MSSLLSRAVAFGREASPIRESITIALLGWLLAGCTSTPLTPSPADFRTPSPTSRPPIPASATQSPSTTPIPTALPTPLGGEPGIIMFYSESMNAISVGDFSRHVSSPVLTLEDLNAILPDLDESWVLISTTPSPDPNYLLLTFCRIDADNCSRHSEQSWFVITISPLAIARLVLPPGEFASDDETMYRNWKWSPDGTRLVAFSNPWTKPASNLYIIRRDGSGLTRHRIVAYSGEPFWSSDGSQLLWNEDGFLQVMDAQAGDVRRMETPLFGNTNLWGFDPSPECISFSPSGNSVAYVDRTGLAIFLANSDFSDPRPLQTPNEGIDPYSGVTYAGCRLMWSPDQSYLLVAFELACRDFACNPPGMSLLYRTDTGEQLTFPFEERRICGWTPDGSIASSPRDDFLSDVTLLRLASLQSAAVPGLSACPIAWYRADDALPLTQNAAPQIPFGIPTPTVAPWTPSAPPALYDNFDSTEPMYLKWTSTISDTSIFSYVRESGVLRLRSSGSGTDDGFVLRLTQLESSSIDEVQAFEATVSLLSVDSETDRGFVLVAILIETDMQGDWYTDCSIRANTASIDYPFISCQVYDNGEVEFLGPYLSSVDLATPYTFRIELNPATAALRYYVNGSELAAYTPRRSNRLLNAHFSPAVQLWAYAGTHVLAEVDDVRMAP